MAALQGVGTAAVQTPVFGAGASSSMHAVRLATGSLDITLPEKLSMAAPQKVDATAMQIPVGEPAMLPSQMDSTTPSVSTTSDSTSKPVGTCTHMLLHRPFACLRTRRLSCSRATSERTLHSQGTPVRQHSHTLHNLLVSVGNTQNRVALELVASVSVTECSMTIPRMAVMIGMPERMIWFRDRLISTRLALLATILATCRHQLHRPVLQISTVILRGRFKL